MNDLTNEKYMTSKELAEVLNVSRETINAHARKMGLTRNGVATRFNEEQATQIKNAIEHSGRKDLQNVLKVESINSDYEMELMTQKVINYHIQRANQLQHENNELKLQNESLKLATKTMAIQLEENAPMVDFAKSVTDSTDAIDIGTASKVLNMGIGRNRMFELLRNKHILQSNNLPYQKYIDAGYFRVIETKFTTPNGETHIYFKTIVYQTGLDYIRNIMKEVSA